MWQIIPKRWVRKSVSSQPDPNKGCSALSRGPLLPGRHAGGCSLPGPSAQDSPQSHLPSLCPVSSSVPHVSPLWWHQTGEERAFRTTARAGREAGGGGRASKGTRACCHHPAPLLPKLPKFTSPELKLSSKPPSARHEGRAYFTRETQGPRRGGVVIQPASLNKSVAETGRPPRPPTSQSPLQSVPPALLGV